MSKLNRQEKRIAAFVVGLIVLAVICRMLGRRYRETLRFSTGLIRSGIYIFLFAAWGVSLGRRIIQVRLRRYMVGIAGSMVFWFLIRTLKYFFISPETMPDAARFLWYAYYIPMLMLPMLSLFAAISLGKPEQYRVPALVGLLWIPTILFTLTVLTNDLHQTVFSFPAEYPVWTDYHYSYAVMYWIVLAWMAVNAVLAMGIILRKCRIPHSKTVLRLPLIPFSLMIVYGFLCVTAWQAVEPFAGDMTAVYCVLVALIFESCIQCGLIRSNSHYTELFMASAVAAQITDKDLNVCYTAENVKPVEKHIMAQAKEEAVILDNGIRLCAEPVSGGYVYWQEDISALLAVLDELSGTKEELKSYGGLLEEENKQKRRRRQLEEQKRLFEIVQRSVKPHLTLLAECAGELREADDEETARKALGRLTVIGAYLKRHSNLVMLAEGTGRIPAEELGLCLRESVSNLQFCGVACALRFTMEGELALPVAERLFDFYETAVELSLTTLTDMTVFVAGDAVSQKLTLLLSCNADMTALFKKFENSSITNESGIWYCVLTLWEEVEPYDQISQK